MQDVYQARTCLHSALEKQRRRPDQNGEFAQHEQIIPPVWHDEVTALRLCLKTLLDRKGVVGSEEETIAAFEGLQFAAHLVGPAGIYSSLDLLRIADAIYAYWESAPGKISMHSILEAYLKLGTETSPQLESDRSFSHQLLHILRDGYSAGNKRVLQILATVFPYASDAGLKTEFPDLWQKLVESLSESTGAVQAAKTLSKLALRSYEDNDIDALATRLLPVVRLSDQGSRTVVVETVLPAIFAARPQLPTAMLSQLKDDSTHAEHLSVFLAVYRVALSMEKPADLSALQVEIVLNNSLTHGDPHIRYESFRLLVLLPYGKAGTSLPIPSRHWDLYREFWTYNIDDLDSASVQTGLIGVWKDFLNKCRTSSYASKRDLLKLRNPDREAGTRSTSADQHANNVSSIQTFLEWWLDLAVEGLRPGKPYRSVMNALSYLEVLCNSEIDPDLTDTARNKIAKFKGSQQWGVTPSVSQRRDLRDRLLGCVTFSTYVNVKQSACALLQRWPIEMKDLQPYLSTALELVQRQRDADISSGILLLRLYDGKVSATASDADHTSVLNALLATAGGCLENDGSPIVPHGVLSALAQLLCQNVSIGSSRSADKALHLQCVNLINHTWIASKGIMTSDDNLDPVTGDNDDEGDTDSARILNQAWRSVAAASDLLSTLMLHAIGDGHVNNLDLHADLNLHSQQFATWLSAITHRGAFSHIAAAYGKVCHCLNRRSSSHARLPDQWTNEHLNYVLETDRPLTRRGAGLPLLIAASLCGASKTTVENAFSRLFASLDPESRRSDVTQSHALNIIRALFQDGKLTSQTQPYISPAFVYAVRGFGAKAWEVRNGSLLLYSALVYRSFGARKNLTTVNKRVALNEFFASNSDLIDLFRQELEERSRSISSESLGSVFAILLVLSLLSASAAAAAIIASLRPAVDRYIASPVWQVRVAAAAAATGLITPDIMDEAVRAAVTAAAQSVQSNEVHGLLLRALYILKTTPVPPSEQTVHCMQAAFEHMIHRSDCLPIQTLILQIHTVLRELCTASRLNVSPAVRTACQAHKAPGYKSWVVAKTTYLLHHAPTILPEFLEEHCILVPQALEVLDADTLKHTSVVSTLKELLLSREAKYGLQMQLAVLLAGTKDISFKPAQTLDLVDLHKRTTSRPLREALLPLLARNAQIAEVYDTVLASIDSSSESRLSGCLAISCLSKAQLLSSMKLQLRLLDFLQDEDSEIRAIAADTALHLLNLQIPTQTSKILALLRRNCAANGDSSLANALIARQRQSLAELIQQLTDNVDALFAEEKANVYKDEYTDLRWMQAVCESYPAEQITGHHDEVLAQQAHSAIKQLAMRLGAPAESPTIAELKFRVAALQASMGKATGNMSR